MQKKSLLLFTILVAVSCITSIMPQKNIFDAIVQAKLPREKTLSMLDFDPALSCISEISFVAQLQEKLTPTKKQSTPVLTQLAHLFNKNNALQEQKAFFDAFEVLPTLPLSDSKQKNGGPQADTCLDSFEKKMLELDTSPAPRKRTPSTEIKKILASLHIGKKKKDTPQNSPTHNNPTHNNPTQNSPTQSMPAAIDHAAVAQVVKNLHAAMQPTLEQAKKYPLPDCFLYIKNMLMTFLRRIVTDSNEYVSYIAGTVTSNFAGTPGITANTVYAYLGFDVPTIPSPCIPYKSIYTCIDEKKKKAASEQEKFALRQISYLFSTHLGRQEFDAYLEGESALKKLALVVPNTETEEYVKQLIIELFQDISVCSANVPAT